jgi:sulfur carrier protein ThiS
VASVTVFLHTIYQLETPNGLVRKLVLPLKGIQNVKDILAHVGVSYHPESTLLVVNGKIVEPEYLLKAGDEVHLIPAISGGSIHIK